MKTTVSRDQLLHDLALVSTRAYIDAYVKVELAPTGGLNFDGGDLAREAMLAYDQAMFALDMSISEY